MWRQTENALGDIANRRSKRQRSSEQNGDEQKRGAQRNENPEPDALHRPNENKMSDRGRGRASLGVEVWKSSQKRSGRRSAVRSIVWLGVWDGSSLAKFIASPWSASPIIRRKVYGGFSPTSVIEVSGELK